MATTRLGLGGPSAAYPGFSAKSSAAAAISQYTIVVVARPQTIIVGAE